MNRFLWGMELMKDNIVNYEILKETSEEALKSLQKEYMEPQMTIEQLSRLKMKMQDAKRENRKDRNRTRVARLTATAAALVIALIALPNMSPAIAYAMEQIPVIGQLVKVVTFRDYKYEDEQYRADIEIPELVIEAESQEVQAEKTLENTTDEINMEIQEISNELLNEFENHMQEELGYKELIVESEVLVTTQNYFTLKLSCYQGEASGYKWNYFYTIDLTSGERLRLKDIFVEGSDYINLISENIKEQMRSRMAQDENVSYWLDDEIEELNFKTISEETSFYINEKDNVVISFNQGEVAAMYMGIVEFEIPTEVLEDIRK